MCVSVVTTPRTSSNTFCDGFVFGLALKILSCLSLMVLGSSGFLGVVGEGLRAFASFSHFEVLLSWTYYKS